MTPRPPSHPARRQLGRALGVAACAWLLAPPLALAHDDHAGHQASAGLARSEHRYALPAVALTRADGRRMTLAQALDDGRPVLLNFVYTTCNAICPVTSQVFAEARARLGADRDRVNMVSLSIDPEQDTPARLTEYARRFGGAGEWAHFTSSSADATKLQRAFEAWRGDKMNHQPVSFVRAAPGQPWVRLDGFAGPTMLLAEVRKALAQAQAAAPGQASAAATPAAPCGPAGAGRPVQAGRPNPNPSIHEPGAAGAPNPHRCSS